MGFRLVPTSVTLSDLERRAISAVAELIVGILLRAGKETGGRIDDRNPFTA